MSELLTQFYRLKSHLLMSIETHTCLVAYNRKYPVLIYSDNGISRSAAIAIAFISFHMRLDSQVQKLLFSLIFIIYYFKESIWICWRSSNYSSTTIISHMYWWIKWEISNIERNSITQNCRIWRENLQREFYNSKFL